MLHILFYCMPAVYPTLDVMEEEEEEGCGSSGGGVSKGVRPGRKRHSSSDQEDMLWKPHGESGWSRDCHMVRGADHVTYGVLLLWILKCHNWH